MNKELFLRILQRELAEYTQDEIQKSLSFYSEMIDDRVEDGMTEEEAVKSLGSIEEIVEQIKMELPITTLVKQSAKQKMKGKTFPTWAIILLILGSPVWLSLLIAGAAVLFSMYMVFWSLVIVVWSVAVAGFCIPLVGIMGTVYFSLHFSLCNILIYSGLILAGLGVFILLVLLASWVTHGMLQLHRLFFRGLKNKMI